MSGLFRIAPTPSGFLHKGNIFNFIFIWLWAKKSGGRVLLRIDDLDFDRSRPEYLHDIFRVLEQLGLEWDIGPASVDDFVKNWSQKHRMESYFQLLKNLQNHENIYACSCSRKELGNAVVYPGNCVSKNMLMDAPNISWRIRAKGSVEFVDENLGDVGINMETEIGDFVVRRRDGIPAYQIASVADDLFFGVTHVVRGMDLLHSTAMQLYLAKKLEKDSFGQIRFWHHNLLLADTGNKISKSAGWQKEAWHYDSAIFAEFAEWQGWRKPESQSLRALLDVATDYWV